MNQLKAIILSVAILAPILFFGYAPQTNAGGCDFNQSSSEFCNPIPDRDLKAFALRVMQYIMGIIALLAIVMIVVAGGIMVGSAGNAGLVKQAKTMAFYAAIGFALALLAYSIIAIVRNAIF